MGDFTLRYTQCVWNTYFSIHSVPARFLLNPSPEFTWSHNRQPLCTLAASHLKCSCLFASREAKQGGHAAKVFVQCMYKVARNECLEMNVLEMCWPVGQSLTNEGWGSVDKYSSFVIPQWDRSFFFFFPFSFLFYLFLNFILLFIGIVLKATSQEGPQQDWTLAALSSHQSSNTCPFLKKNYLF